MSDLMKRLRQRTRGPVGPGYGPSWPVNPDGPEAADRIEQLEAENGALRRCLLPAVMAMAQAECCDEPMPDDAVVLHFMGSGASDQVTAGELRAALRSRQSTGERG